MSFTDKYKKIIKISEPKVIQNSTTLLDWSELLNVANSYFVRISQAVIHNKHQFPSKSQTVSY